MRKKVILSMFVALMGSISSVAATWTAPTVTGQELKTGETQYLYNTKADMFLNGNSSSVTCLSDEGLALYVTANSDGTYLLANTADEGVSYTYVYYEDYQTAKIGGASTLERKNWTIELQSDGTYYIRPNKADIDYGEDYFPEMWMGWMNDGTTTVYPLLDIEENYGLSWKFVGETEYAKFYSMNALSDAMTTAQNDGIDITSALEVYNNSESTNDELDAATTALNALIKQYNIEHATLDNPVSLSEILVNYSFDEQFENSSTTVYGWTQEPTGSFTTDNSELDGDYTTIGRWAWGDQTFEDAKIYQKVTDAPNGKYLMKVRYICIDQEPANPESDGKDSEDYSVTGNTLYAVTALGTSSTNLASMSRWGSAEASVEFFVTDGNLEVGVEMENSTANWFRLAGFELTYYGQDAIKEELQAIVDEAKTVTGGMNQTYSDALSKCISEAEELIASSTATVPEYTAKAEELTAAINAAQENIDAYAKLQETYNTADEILNELEGEANEEVIALSDYMAEIDIETILATYPYTTEELEEIIDNMDLLAQSAQHSLIEEGTDVTQYITNPSFDTGNADGWTFNMGEAASLGYANNEAEAFMYSYNISQTLRGMPNGTYKLKVQAFQRVGWTNEDDENFASDPDALREKVNTFIYLNSFETRVKNIMECGVTDITDGEQTTYAGYVVPNNMYNAQLFFAAGCYENEVEGFVTDGTITFGIKNEANTMWSIWDNFRLEYVGKDLEKAIELLQEKLDATTPYLAEKMNGEIKQKIEAACTKAEEIINDPNADFDAALDAIVDMDNAIVGADESIESFKTLAHADSIAAVDLAYEGVAATTTGQELQTLYTENHAAYESESSTLTAEKIEELTEQYKSLALKAKIEKGFKANEDITYLLSNPSYEDQWNLGSGVSGVYNPPYGWSFVIDSVECTTAEEMYAAGLNNYFSPDLNVDCTDGVYGYCMQSGDFPDVYMYQTIEGLPAGYYKVTVDMVIPNDNDDYRLAGQRLFVNNSAMYYGYEEEYDLDALEEAHPYEVERTFGCFDEVNSQDNGDLGDKGPLNTLEVVVHIAADEALTLGVRTDGIWEYTYKSTGVDGWDNHGWCKFDNTRLTCVSLDDPTGISDVNTEGNVKSQQVFNIGGNQMNNLQKGVNIVRQQMENGSVVTKKVIVK